MRLILFLIFTFLGQGIFAQVIQSPAEYLPTNYSKEFTPHHLVIDYFKYVAEKSTSVQFQQYGWTIEKRPLCVVIISSPENISNLESIRLNNLKLTGLVDGKANKKKAKPIVWINFGVHGNEAGTTETSLNVLYELIQNPAKLKDVVVILNPSLNPDGFDRYVNWNRQVSNQQLMDDALSREHQEPWPTGRTNHYYHDLNRDWAWGTQIETKALLKIYHQWMPHIVPDLHEQHPGKSYFFAPASEPIHDYVTSFQRSFQHKIGANNAKAFDAKNWLYYTKEVFDLFYPGYGDTYPTFNGAIGMTYEQAGHSTAGKSFLLDNGQLLTIEERIQHHTAACLSTVQTAVQYKTELVKNFEQYFKNSRQQSISKYQGYVIKKGRSQYRLNKLKDLLDLHQIKYSSVRYSKDAKGFNYQNQNIVSFSINPGDLVIDVRQSMGVLANVLLEPKSHLVDSMTYDISAWSLPYIYDLEAYALEGALPKASIYPNKNILNGIQGHGNYAWIIPWNDIQSGQFLSVILQKGLQVRYATKKVHTKEHDFNRGSLLVTQSDNKQVKNIKKILKEASEISNLSIFAQASGYTKGDSDFGSSSFVLIKQPKIALTHGSLVSAYNYGEIWQFLDKELTIPFVALSVKDLKANKIWDFNTLIFAQGEYDELRAKTKNYINSWVRKGGNLILFGHAIETLTLKSVSLEKVDMDYSREDFRSYAEKDLQELSSNVPGGFVKVLLDNTHPLGFGYQEQYYSLKASDLSYAPLSDGYTVGHTPKEIETIGFFGEDTMKHLGNNLIFGVQEIGDGQVVFFIDNPLFRSFLEGGKLMMANALFFR